MSNINNSMSVRERLVFEEWGAAPSQMGGSPPGLPPQSQGQTNRQVSRQNQPRTQVHVPIRNQRQPGNQQRKPSLGQSQGYIPNNASTGSIRGNRTALIIPSGQVPQTQAQSRGRVQHQRYGAVRANVNDKPTNLALSRPVNPNASLPRQPLPNQVQDQAAGDHVNANPGVQMQAQDKARGQSLRQDQGFASESITPGADSNGNSSAQTSQTTHRRYPMGRNKRRNRGPTVFDEWKAQATKDDTAGHDKSKHDESSAAMESPDIKLKDILDEWTVGGANFQTHSGISGETIVSGAPADTNDIGPSPIKPASKPDERPEGSKGRFGRRRGGRRHKNHSGPENDKGNEKEIYPDRRRRERAGSSGSKASSKVDSHAEKEPVDPVSPSVAHPASNEVAVQGESKNDLQKTRSRKSCSFSSDGPKLETIGEDNVSWESKAVIPDKTASSHESTVNEQKKAGLEPNPRGKESDVCEWSRDVPAGAPSPSTPMSLRHPEIDQARKDNTLKVPTMPLISATTENTPSTPPIGLSTGSEAPASNPEERQSAQATASEVGHDCLSQKEQMPIRSHQRSTGTASPVSNRSSSSNFRPDTPSHIAQSKRNCSGQHDPPQQDGYLAPCGKRISKIMLNRLAEGIKYPSRGTTVYFLPSFVEDPWEGLKPMKIERPDNYRALVDEAMED